MPPAIYSASDIKLFTDVFVHFYSATWVRIGTIFLGVLLAMFCCAPAAAAPAPAPAVSVAPASTPADDTVDDDSALLLGHFFFRIRLRS